MISTKAVADSGCDIGQTNYDSSFLMFVILFPIYLYSVYIVEYPYLFKDVFIQILCSILVVVGMTIFGTAIKYGKGGPVNAIKASDAIVHTTLVIIFKGIIPNWLQSVGVGLGFVGVICLVM